MNRLAGKTAVKTGTAREIGLSFAKADLREGALVVLSETDIQAAEVAARDTGEHAIAVHLDVAQQVPIDACVARNAVVLSTTADVTDTAIFPAMAETDYIGAQTYKVHGVNWMS